MRTEVIYGSFQPNYHPPLLAVLLLLYLSCSQGPLAEHGVDPGGEQERANDVSTPGWLHSTGTVTQIQ